MNMNQLTLREPWLRVIAQVFAGTPVYAVGGAVRNTLMGLPVSDMDLCGPARPEEVTALCEGTAVQAKPRAAHFGTVELHVDGHMAEYTTFREDSYRTGHQPVAVRFADTLEEDALRRDFSVNALYSPLTDPETVIDPTGGLRHLTMRVLHTVTEDPDQVLKDDGLRILRAVRFQAELGFTVSDAVMKSCKKYAVLLDAIAPERKRDELTRLLLADLKYPMLERTAEPVSLGFTTLAAVGAWPTLFGSLKSADLYAFDHAKALDLAERFALLYHGETPESLTQRMAELRFGNRDAKAAAAALAALRTMQDPQSKISDQLAHGLIALQSAGRILAALAKTNPAYQNACDRAVQTLAVIEEAQLPPSLRELAVGGEDLLAFCRETGMPREQIGAMLHTLWQAAVNRRVPNTRNALLAHAGRVWIDTKPRQ